MRELDVRFLVVKIKYQFTCGTFKLNQNLEDNKSIMATFFCDFCFFSFPFFVLVFQFVWKFSFLKSEYFNEHSLFTEQQGNGKNYPKFLFTSSTCSQISLVVASTHSYWWAWTWYHSYPLKNMKWLKKHLSGFSKNCKIVLIKSFSSKNKEGFNTAKILNIKIISRMLNVKRSKVFES